MIVKLIVPTGLVFKDEKEKWGGDLQSVITGVSKYPAIVASIPVLAGLTPKDVDVVIQDENIEAVDFDAKVDLVGITANTATVERAYQIADEFRRRNVKVVMGGIHASMLPDEALGHADAVVCGEAELSWPELIGDFRNDSLKRIYRSSDRTVLDEIPMPRYDLIKRDRYIYYNVQTSRGCPYDCDYCSVQKFFGRQYRSKSVDKVIEEVRFLNSLEKKLIFFVDDNFAADRKRTKELLRALIPLKTPYTIQARIEISEDEELLDLLHDSGCLSIIIGFESVYQKNLDLINKKARVESYFRAVEKIQSKGLLILGAFMLGQDHDEVEVFEDTVKFIRDSRLGNCFPAILTPLPGTDFYFRMQRENRLLPSRWTYFDASHVCFKPKNMSPEDLLQGYFWTYQRLFDLNAVWDRVMGLYRTWNAGGRRLHERMFPLVMNLSSHYVASSYPPARNPAAKEGGYV